MTSPPSSPSALSSGALAERECPNCGSPWMEGTGLFLCGEGISGNVHGGCRVPYTAARIRALVARLEQAEQERADRDVLIGLMCATDVRVNGCACTEISKCYLHGVEIPRRLADGFEPVSDDEFRFMHAAAVEYVRAEAAESALAAFEAGRVQWKAVASEVGVLTLTESLAACEHTRDQALVALHYIKQQYGPLDGVGWNRLTGDEA